MCFEAEILQQDTVLQGILERTHLCELNCVVAVHEIGVISNELIKGLGSTTVMLQTLGVDSGSLVSAMAPGEPLLHKTGNSRLCPFPSCKKSGSWSARYSSTRDGSILQSWYIKAR